LANSKGSILYSLNFISNQTKQNILHHSTPTTTIQPPKQQNLNEVKKNKMSKDQTIGALIVFACIIIVILYVGGLFFYGWTTNNISALAFFGTGEAAVANVQLWLIATPVLISVIAILAIGTWIGYTTLTTPPPKPIDDITNDIQAETTAETT
jgi:heme/copper-type cytochrome/quinol oxidase subunit 2